MELPARYCVKCCDDKKRNFCHKEKGNDNNEHHGGVVGVPSRPLVMHLLPAKMDTRISQMNKEREYYLPRLFTKENRFALVESILSK